MTMSRTPNQQRQRPTIEVATRIVEGLAGSLSKSAPADLGNIRSVFVTGSYVRGDWLDRNSDLDLHVLFKPGAGGPSDQDPGYRRVQSIVNDLRGGETFASHTPGGVDWSTHPAAPQTEADVRNVDGFPPFSVFLFDFMAHSRILWGEDFRPRIPPAPDPVSLVNPWFESSLVKLARLGTGEIDRERAAFRAYKCLALTQIVFGERTLDKTRMLNAYLANVPAFPMKADGERLVRKYFGAIYPDWKPQFDDVPYYADLVRSLRDVIVQSGRA